MDDFLKSKLGMKWILLLIFMMSISFILFCCHTGNSVYCRYQFGKLRFCSDTVDWGTIYLGRTYQKCLEIYNPDTMKIPLRIVNCISGIKVYHKSILAGPLLHEGINILVKSIDTLVFEFQPTDTNSLGTLKKEFILEVDHVLLFSHLLMQAQIQEEFDTIKNSSDYPQLSMSDNFWDFGTIQSGEKPCHLFKIRNEGNGNLIIRKIEASCGCTAVAPRERIILSGEETILKVQFDSFGKSGKQRKSINIFSNDPKNPIQEVLIQGEVEKF